VATKIAQTVREILKAGTVHIDGTDLRLASADKWGENMTELRAYVKTLPSKKQKFLAIREGMRLAADTRVLRRPVLSMGYDRRRARAVSSFAAALLGEV